VNHSNLNASLFQQHDAESARTEPTDLGGNNQDNTTKETRTPAGEEELPAYCERTPSFSAFANMSGDDELPSTVVLSPASLKSQDAANVGDKRKARSEPILLPKPQKSRVNPATTDSAAPSSSQVSDSISTPHGQVVPVPTVSPSSTRASQVPDATTSTINQDSEVLLLSQFIHRIVSTLNQVEKEREMVLSRVDQLHNEVASLGRVLTEQVDMLNAKVEDLIKRKFPDSS